MPQGERTIYSMDNDNKQMNGAFGTGNMPPANENGTDVAPGAPFADNGGNAEMPGTDVAPNTPFANNGENVEIPGTPSESSIQNTVATDNAYNAPQYGNGNYNNQNYNNINYNAANYNNPNHNSGNYPPHAYNNPNTNNPNPNYNNPNPNYNNGYNNGYNNAGNNGGYNNYGYPPYKPKRSKLPIILIALIPVLIVILIVIGLIVFSIISSGDDSDYENVEQTYGEGDNEIYYPEETWEIVDYEEEYPFYAIEAKYLDGEETDETRVNYDETRYDESEMKLYYFKNSAGGQSKRVLYINGSVSDYVEYVDEMSEEEWVIEGCDNSRREYARKYVNGEKTTTTEYTGVIYDSYVYVAYDGSMFNTVYGDGRPLTYTAISEMEDDVWVVDGKTYDSDGYKELATRYVDGVATDETKPTGRVYDTFTYTVKNTENKNLGDYYRVLYVNGHPTEEKEYIDELSEQEWLISGHDIYYKEYAVLYKDGVADAETRYTGRVVTVEQWKREQSAEYYYERKYVNGVATDECRNYVKIVNQTPAKQPEETKEPEKTEEVKQPEPPKPVQKPVVAYTEEVLDKAKHAWYLVSYDANGNEISRTYLRAAWHKTDKEGNDIWS